jgi:hypothetical protein
MFLMLPILFGSVVALIPLIIHLMHRQRTKPINWAAMQFLLDSPIQQRRRAHLDHWLLMLLRTALLLLLVALLARPMISGWLLGRIGPGAGGTPADIGIVIDHSVSMGRRAAGGKTLFAQAIEQLEKLRDMMHPADTVSVVLAEHVPRALTPTPVGRDDVGRLVQTLRQMDNGLTDGPIPDAIGTAREVINKGSHLKKLIVVLSDQQRSGWQVNGDGAWRAALGDRLAGPDRDIGVYALDVPPVALPANLSVGRLRVEPGLVGVGRSAQLFATLSNTGPGDAPDAPLRLIVDGRTVANQRLGILPAGQAQTVRFDFTFMQAGWHWAKLQLDATDALDADNDTIGAIKVWEKLPVLVVDGQLTNLGGFASSDFLLAALRPGGPSLVVPKVISAADVGASNLDDYAVVILNDVPRLPVGVAERLANYAQAGHGVWVILGRRTDPAYLDDALGRTLLPALVEASTHATVEQAPTIAVKDPQDPMVALLAAAERNAFAGSTLTDWWKLSSPTDTSHVVLATSTGDPLVLTQTVGNNGGRIVLWATSVDGQWNNLPLMANSFVPLVHETLYRLAAGQNQAEGHELAAGQPIVWTGGSTPAVDSATLTRPQGAPVALQPILTNGKYLVTYGDTFVPGLYKMEFAPTNVPQPVFYAVGIDQRELDPAQLSAADIEWLKTQRYLTASADLRGVAEALGAQSRGIEIWPLAALLVLAGLVAETLLTRRMVRLQTGQDVRSLLTPGEVRA